jgi:hypothetical protein
MADKRISELPAAGALTATDVLAVVQAAGTRKVPVSTLDARWPRRGSAGYVQQRWRLNQLIVNAPDAVTWVDIDPSGGLDTTVTAAAGDRVELAVQGMWTNHVPTADMNAYTMVSGARVTLLETRSGLPGGRGIGSVWMPVCVSYLYTVAAGDLSTSGTVTFRIVAALTAGAYPATKTYQGPMGVSARNWG